MVDVDKTAMLIPSLQLFQKSTLCPWARWMCASAWIFPSGVAVDQDNEPEWKEALALFLDTMNKHDKPLSAPENGTHQDNSKAIKGCERCWDGICRRDMDFHGRVVRTRVLRK